jgi:hypothetical protein
VPSAALALAGIGPEHAIKERIVAGTFHFDEEFPNFPRLDVVMNTPGQRTCGHVFDF